MINDDVSQKNTIYVKKTILGILQHVVMKIENIQQVLLTIQEIT